MEYVPTSSANASERNTTRNAYGNTYVSGNARVQLGDTHHHNRIPSLKYVEGAEFNSYEQVHTACHPETRKDLLQSIQTWAREAGGKSIFWLNGMAGTGKSTIAYTVAKWLNEQADSDSTCLGASFFFKRGEGHRASAALFFPTIVAQLCRVIPDLNAFVEQEIQRDSFVCSKALGHQFDKLLRRPLQSLDVSRWRRNYVVVVDALDECDTFNDIEALLQLWSSLFLASKIPVQLFITSRPELSVQITFADMPAHSYHDLILHELPAPVIKQDILTFLRDEFAMIRKRYNKCVARSAPLDQNWPTEEILQQLTSVAVPLFIVATTLCRLVFDKENPLRYDPLQRLRAILESPGLHVLSKVGQVYHAVLLQLLPSMRDSSEMEQAEEEAQISVRFRNVVGTVVNLAEPLSLDALAALLCLDLRVIESCVKPLQSVLSIPADPGQPLRVLHLSFGEYLSSKELKDKRFHIDKRTTHEVLLRHCLQLLLKPGVLHRDMCNLTHHGIPRQGVSAELIQEHITPAVQYACRYWTYHCQMCQHEIVDDGEIHEFLRTQFLYWLEVLSLLDILSGVFDQICMLRSLISTPSKSTQVNALLEDADRFISRNRYVIDLAPLQIYSSAIIFLPQKSIIRQVYSNQIPAWIEQCPIMPEEWSEELLTLEGHTDKIAAIAFSPDGGLLVSGGARGEVRLWNARTGKELQKLGEFTDPVEAITFSPDGSKLATASEFKRVYLWNTNTVQLVDVLEGHKRRVTTVAFSPDGKWLASGSWDDTIRIWDVHTREQVQVYTEPTMRVQQVVFSPNADLLASTSVDKIVRLWNTQRWKKGKDTVVRIINGDFGSLQTLAFTRNGSLLLSMTRKTIRLWDTSTGSEVHRPEKRGSLMNAVAFPSFPKWMVSTTFGAVWIWDADTGQVIQKYQMKPWLSTTNMLSPDGFVIALCGLSGTIGLRRIDLRNSVGTSARPQQRQEEPGRPLNMIFSTNGKFLASTHLEDLMYLWDVTTGQVVLKHLWDVTTGHVVLKDEELATKSPNTVQYHTLAKHLLWKLRNRRRIEVVDDERYEPFNFQHRNELILRNEGGWISDRRRRNVLWMPSEYRYSSVINKDTVAVGCDQGVFFIKIAPSWHEQNDR